jgi:hypothetical protein
LAAGRVAVNAAAADAPPQGVALKPLLGQVS